MIDQVSEIGKQIQEIKEKQNSLKTKGTVSFMFSVVI